MNGVNIQLISALLLCTCACSSVIQLPPRAAPAATLPNLALPREPIAEGSGRLVIDVVDGPMQVTLVPSSTTWRPSDPRQLRCITPCIRDLPFGIYDLYFSNSLSDKRVGDSSLVEIVSGTTIVRHAPGIHRAAPQYQPFPDLLNTIGAILVIGALGAGFTKGPQSAAPIMLSLGGAMLVFGMSTHRYAGEEQTGATTTFLQPVEPRHIGP